MKHAATIAATIAGAFVFPGEIAGASLKHIGSTSVPCSLSSFSPAKSPGPH